VRHEYARNPNWYKEGRPFLDRYHRIIIVEPAAALAQFEAGQIWEHDQLSQNDVLPVKDRHPEMLMYLEPVTRSPGGQYMYFSNRDGDIMRDDRMRKAVSMSIDRDAFIDAIIGAQDFRDAGLPYETRWNSNLNHENPNWIDPRDEAFGEGSQFFQFNVEEAKKLAAAAGYDGEPIDFTNRDQQGNFTNTMQIIGNFLEQEAGFTINRLPTEVTTWRNLRNSKGMDFNGIIQSVGTSYNEDAYIVARWTPDGKDAYRPDPWPTLTDLAVEIRGEFDRNRYTELVHQLQAGAAEQMTNIIIELNQPGFTLRWPWFQNHGVIVARGFDQQVTTGRPYTEYWYDESKT
jgi:ABC-type transport system substrate-binding protein